LSTHPATQQFAAHVNPSLVRLLGALGYGRVFTRASGTKLWDSEGHEYLDGLAGLGTASVGHNPPKLLEHLREILAEDAPGVVHAGIGIHTAELAAKLARLAAPLTRCMFATSGSDAIDLAMKLARAATKKKGIIYCKGAFHGMGIGPLSIMGFGRQRDPYEPLLPECYEIDFDDLPALDRALKEHKAGAFFVQPVQAEAGIIVPRRDYLSEAQALCTKHGTLLVLDDAQTGLGRTGAMFSHQLKPAFVPDILVLGESLGGGLVPISATLTTPDVHDRAYGRVDRFAHQGSTFGGWTLGCRVGLATLRMIDEDHLADAARLRGDQLVERLRDEVADHPFVRRVSGRGLLVGLELGPTIPRSSGLLARILPGLVDLVSKRVFGQWLAVRLLEHGILCQPASQQWNVLRISPPLTISEPEVDQIVDSIVAVLKEYTELRPLLTDVGQRLGTQLLSGGSF
jgi:putrescine aminotransferase